MSQNDLIPVFDTTQNDRTNVRANATPVSTRTWCRTVDGDIMLDIFCWSGELWYGLNDDNSVIYEIVQDRRHLLMMVDPDSLCGTCNSGCKVYGKEACDFHETV